MTWVGAGHDVLRPRNALGSARGVGIPTPRMWGDDGVELTALASSFPRPDSRLRGNDVGGCGIWRGRVWDMTWEGAGYGVGGCGSDDEGAGMT